MQPLYIPVLSPISLPPHLISPIPSFYIHHLQNLIHILARTLEIPHPLQPITMKFLAELSLALAMTVGVLGGALDASASDKTATSTSSATSSSASAATVTTTTTANPYGAYGNYGKYGSYGSYKKREEK
ncbi:hypothetical protein NHQ30_011517 [Ciborinia camelliae]|nr:hypothetical protein NHQ30_011517 [Ciborinia camelliae]